MLPFANKEYLCVGANRVCKNWWSLLGIWRSRRASRHRYVINFNIACSSTLIALYLHSTGYPFPLNVPGAKRYTYTRSVKKQDTLLSPITSPNIV